MQDALTNLTELLRELPGIGPRQARRLAFWLMRREPTWVNRFATALLDSRSAVHSCTLCMRLYFASDSADICQLCRDHRRDDQTLLVVEKDVDLENIDKTGAYRGRYYVLGGTTSPLDEEPEKKIRIQALRDRVLNDPELRELILALSATTEGEDTATYLRDQLSTITQQRSIALTILGRGLSTGTELEYVDADTMHNALKGRT